MAKAFEEQIGAADHISIQNLTKKFNRAGGSEVRAVDDLTLGVKAGEMLVLLGPSGCGKTTLLRCLAGLESPDHGEIVSDGQTVYSSNTAISVSPDKRKMSMLFQSYALWPHLTVAENISYPLKVAKVSKVETERRLSEILHRVGCADIRDQYPSEISGGQQQRVALARALIPGNGVILFDEPLSNVDAKVRQMLRIELLSLQKDIGFSAVYVTHDQAEALELGDRITVLREGKIAQIGSPREIYLHPNSLYVANFVGIMNEIEVQSASLVDGRFLLHTSLGEIEGREARNRLDAPGELLVATFRPERVRISREEFRDVNVWRGKIRTVMFLGASIEYLIDIGDQTVRALITDDDRPFLVDEEVWVHVPVGDIVAFVDDRRKVDAASKGEGRYAVANSG